MQQATSLAPIKKTPKSETLQNERTTISLSTPSDVRYWMQSFDMSEEQLRLLVRMHGTAAAPIRAALGVKKSIARAA